MQGQESKVNMNFVVVEYQEKVSNLANENVVLQAFVKQLQAQIEQLQEQLEELSKSNE